MIKKLIGIPTLVALSLSFSPLAFSDNFGPMKCMQEVMRQLKLTPDQESKIGALKVKFKESMGDKETQMRVLHGQIRMMVQSDNMDESKLDALISEKKDLIGTIMKNKIMLDHQIYVLLDISQKGMFINGVNNCEKKFVGGMKGKME